MTPPKSTLNAKEVAKLLGIDERTFRRWRADGKAPEAIPGSGRTKWRRAHVMAWLSGDAVSHRVQESLQKLKDEGADEAVVSLLRQENASLRRKLSTHGARASVVMSAVQDSFADYRPPTAPPARVRSTKSRDVEEAVLHISDTQIGKVTPTYSTEIAKERLRELGERALTCIDRHRSYARVDRLHVYLGGDMIEGELIFPHQAHLIDQSVFDQACRDAPDALAELLLRLLSEVPNLTVICVPGNHGRVASKNAGSHPRSNWDSVCYETTRLMLMGGRHNPNKSLGSRVTWPEPDSFFQVNEVCGRWRHLVVHGHQIRGWAGIPFYGINRKASKWAMSIPAALKRMQAPVDGWDALYLGHFHTYTQGYVVDRPWYVNGTTESDNDYALEELGEAGSPVQRLQFWTREHGMVADRPLYLSAGV